MNLKKPQNKSEVAKTTVSVTSVFIFTFFVFAALCTILLFLRYSDAFPFAKWFVKNPVVKSLNDYVGSAVTNAQSSDPVELKITEGQMAEAICLTCSTFPLRKATLKMTGEGVFVSGKTSNTIFGINIDVVLKPKIENGQLAFDITEIKAAGVVAPPKIRDPLTQKVEDSLRSFFPSDPSLELREVRSMVGYLFLEGVKK